MKTFFYSAKGYRCQEPCEKGFCVCRCLDLLGRLPHIQNLVVLPGGSNLTDANSMMLRSGDLIILYAGQEEDLETLIESRELFDPFRVILILGEETLARKSRYHLLKPRYLTWLDGNQNELDSVLGKMQSRIIHEYNMHPANNN